MEKTSCDIAILGAGISGLATAWFLKQFAGPSLRLAVIEKSGRAGGWIQTLHSDGFLFEQGPRSFRTAGAGEETLALVESLGLQDQIIAPHPDAKNRYVYQGRHLQRLPKSLWEIPFHPLTRNFLKVLWRDWRMPKRQEEDESIFSFFSRRWGEAWTENLVDPFVSGIYAGDCKRLSLKSCFPLFDQLEQRGPLILGALFHRSVKSEQSAFVQNMRAFPMLSFQKGMETLPLTLARELNNDLYLEKTIKTLHVEKNPIQIEFDQGNCLIAKHVISTLPTFSLASLLPLHASLRKTLENLHYASLAVINVGFSQNVLPFKGFGYLVPSKWGLPLLGCVWDSSAFPQQNERNQTRLTLMMGGSRYPEVEHWSENELVEYTQMVLREHLNISFSPKTLQIKRVQKAIPQFEVGYSLWKQEGEAILRSQFPSLILSGSGWTGVSINDCIAHARRLSRHVIDNLLKSY